MRVEWTSYSSPIGALTVVECEAGPLVVEYPNRAVTIKWAVRLRAAVPELHIAQGSCRITTTWLDDYFGGSPRPFPFPDHLKRWFDLSPAQIAVFKTLRKIPLGETRSYDDVARATRLHPRQIGWLVAANHLAILIPCHRVVGKDGGLVGYGGGLAKKRWLLDHELRAAGASPRSVGFSITSCGRRGWCFGRAGMLVSGYAGEGVGGYASTRVGGKHET